MNLVKLNYQLDWENIKPRAEELVSISAQNSLERNANTSYLNPIKKLNNLPELKEYYNFLLPQVTDFVGSNNILIERAWFTKYMDLGHIIAHTHPTSTAVACLYIEFPTNAGNLEFEIDGNWKEISIKQGDLVIFPGHVKHRSQPNKSNKERWTLTSNFVVRGII